MLSMLCCALVCFVCFWMILVVFACFSLLGAPGLGFKVLRLTSWRLRLGAFRAVVALLWFCVLLLVFAC